MIEFIGVNKINPHPHNPRKDLGDLTELAESIKATGILQNLTVVEGQGGTYTVVIGHRRLAAAKLAGLTDVPCAISDMDLKTQIATMLLENMQRSDLTILEQAEGMQMMLNLGETVGNISEKTGFSESTVRRRVKLLELDRDKFKESVSRGATLQDFAALDAISDIELKNQVLEAIGTPNFNWKLNNAIQQEKSNANKATIITELDKFATRVDSVSGLRYVKYIGLDGQTFDMPNDAGDRKYFYFINPTYIALYAEAEQVVQNHAEDERQNKLQERRESLKEFSRAAFQLRREFIKDYKPSKNHSPIIMEFATKALFEGGYSNFDDDEFAELVGVDSSEIEEFTLDIIQDIIAKSPEKALLAAAYCDYSDSESKSYYRQYDCAHESDTDLDAIYDILVKLGYQMSDEEKSLQDGTHELFSNI